MNGWIDFMSGEDEGCWQRGPGRTAHVGDRSPKLSLRDEEVPIDLELSTFARARHARRPPDLRWAQPLLNAADVHAHRHGEARHDVRPTVADDRIREDVLERR